MPSTGPLEALNQWFAKQDGGNYHPPFPGAIFDLETRRWHKPKTNTQGLEDLKSNFDSGKLSPDEAAKLITGWRSDNASVKKAFLLNKWLLSKQLPPRPGLVPKSGDPKHPDHWILPKEEQQVPNADILEEIKSWPSQFLKNYQKNALRQYKGYSSSAINNYVDTRKVRSGENEAVIQPLVAMIDEAFETIPPLKNDIVVFRGIISDRLHHYKKPFLSKRYMSTSLSKKKALMHGGTAIPVRIPKGSKVIWMDFLEDVSGYSPEEKKYLREDEILLPRNTRFDVIGAGPELQMVSNNDSVTNLRKQTTAAKITSAGMHEHPGYSGVHPVSQHHRHEGKREFTVPEEYWKNPDYFDEGAQEEKPQQINITDIARAHGLDMRVLHRAMQQHYGAGRMSSQVVENEYYDPDKDKFIKIRETMLTPSQIQTAHQLAVELKRRSGRMTRPVRIIKPGVPKTAEPLFASADLFKQWIENQRRGWHTDNNKFPEHPVRVINHEKWFSEHLASPHHIEPPPINQSTANVEEQKRAFSRLPYVGQLEINRFQEVGLYDQQLNLRKHFGVPASQDIKEYIEKNARVVTNTNNSNLLQILKNKKGFIPSKVLGKKEEGAHPDRRRELDKRSGNVVFASVQTNKQGIESSEFPGSSVFGSTLVIFDDSVANRAIILNTDGLSKFVKFEGAIAGKNWKEAAAYRAQILMKMYPEKYKDVDSALSGSHSYIEVHIYGGVPISDIKKVILRRTYASVEDYEKQYPHARNYQIQLAKKGISEFAELLNLLKQLNIPVEIKD